MKSATLIKHARGSMNAAIVVTKRARAGSIKLGIVGVRLLQRLLTADSLVGNSP